MNKFKEIKPMINYRDIKSSYIIKSLFSFLDEKEKLEIIIYNKELQKILSVNINEYKNNTGKYKIGERNGKGWEYIINTNILIFEGEYINGKRNGKGKEYYLNRKLLFEGEYKNGRKWNGNGYNIKGNIEFKLKDGKGNIKEYDEYGKLKYEGEYKNGERNGKGKEYDEYGKIKFEGEYINGKRKEKNII